MQNMGMSEPLTEYRARLEARRATLQRYDKLDSNIAFLRLVAAGVFLVLAWLVWTSAYLSGWLLLVPASVFLGLVIYHERVFQKRNAARKTVRFYEEGIARIEDQWIGRGRSAFTLGDDLHLYAADLDIFGKGSLFELLCTARTSSGETILANWLTSPASRDEILLRQQACDELRNSLDLREDFAVLGSDIRSAIRPALSRWSEAPAILSSAGGGRAAFILAILNTAVFLYYMIADVALPMILVLPVSILFARVLRSRVL